MFKGHPKGLYVAFFANMGERFGFYTMMGILVYYLTAKYGLTGSNAGVIYSIFYASIYALALVGGIIADRTKKYKSVIFVGLITMLGGYILMAIPGFNLVFTVMALFVIALGNGLFKGNLQAVVGQMYDDPKYESKRDSAFSVFYMGINIGALFAPFAASKIIKWSIENQGFTREDALPSLLHKFNNATLKGDEMTNLQELANQVSGETISDMATFAKNYLEAYSSGFNYAFGIAAMTMIISFVVFILFKGLLPDVSKKIKAGAEVKELSPEETRQRMVALFLVFAVVIFFWMAFHQNGLSMSFFARDYTVKSVGAFEYLFFDLKSLVAIIICFTGLINLLQKGTSSTARIISGAAAIGGGALAYYFYTNNAVTNSFSPELFQPFNPSFIVILTPVVLGIFAFLNKRNMEPSAPKKIAIGMIITSVGFAVLMMGSFGLDLYKDLTPDSPRVGVEWLVSTYFILTIAELFLSPMGLSFVAKVSPPKYQGVMQGAWLGATALGNQMLWIGSYLYERIPIWQVWGVFIILCFIAAAFIFSIMKKLEAVAKPKPVEKS